MWKIIWPAALVAFLVDLCTDLIWGNAAVNGVTFIFSFLIAAFLVASFRSARATV